MWEIKIIKINIDSQGNLTGHIIFNSEYAGFEPFGVIHVTGDKPGVVIFLKKNISER